MGGIAEVLILSELLEDEIAEFLPQVTGYQILVLAELAQVEVVKQCVVLVEWIVVFDLDKQGLFEPVVAFVFKSLLYRRNE